MLCNAIKETSIEFLYIQESDGKNWLDSLYRTINKTRAAPIHWCVRALVSLPVGWLDR